MADDLAFLLGDDSFAVTPRSRQTKREKLLSLNAIAMGRERSRLSVPMKGFDDASLIISCATSRLRVKLHVRDRFTPTARVSVADLLARVPTWQLLRELGSRLGHDDTIALADALMARGLRWGEALAELTNKMRGAAPRRSQT